MIMACLMTRHFLYLSNMFCDDVCPFYVLTSCLEVYSNKFLDYRFFTPFLKKSSSLSNLTRPSAN